jgi:hypothetical protein
MTDKLLGNGNGAGTWLKIALAMVPVAGILIQVWADVRELKNQRAAAISAERIAGLEAQVKQHDREIDYNRNQIERIWREKKSND